MRSYVPAYQLISVANLNEALDLLARTPNVWKPFAGGTDLMVLLEAGKLTHTDYLNIWNLKELRGVTVAPEYITIGALTTYTEIREHQILRTEFPMLCQAASETGGLAIQNRGTLGGNIVNASPAADSPPALLAYDADLELISVNGSRRVPYSGFHTGYKQMDIQPDELLAGIHLPRKGQLKHYYRKVGTRKAQAISKLCFAGTASMNNGRLEDVRIAFGSVAPISLRCVRTEDLLRGSNLNDQLIATAQNTLANEIAPISDIRSTKDYRLRVSQNVLAEFLKSLI